MNNDSSGLGGDQKSPEPTGVGATPIVLKARTPKVRLTPFGFHHHAAEFLRIGHLAYNDAPHFSPVPYFLFLRAAELAIKSFLLLRNVPVKRLKQRKLGHNIEALLDFAIEFGLRDLCDLDESHETALRNSSAKYESKAYEYFSIAETMTGHRGRSDLSTLRAAAQQLVDSLEGPCLNAEPGEVER